MTVFRLWPENGTHYEKFTGNKNWRRCLVLSSGGNTGALHTQTNSSGGAKLSKSAKITRSGSIWGFITPTCCDNPTTRYTVGNIFDVAMIRCQKGGATVTYVLARRREMRKNSYVKNKILGEGGGRLSPCWEWPALHVAYLYIGLWFHQYLVYKYFQDTIAKFIDVCLNIV